MTLFDTIRAASRTVSERARLVRIVPQRIASWAAALPLDRVVQPTLDPTEIHLASPDRTLAFVLVLDAINFGSGYFPHLRKRPGRSGYRTIAAALKDWFEILPAITPETLTPLTAEDCARIFGQADPPAPAPIGELMDLYAQALQELGRFARDQFAGRFAALVEGAQHSAEALVRIFDRMPFYRDVHRYDELTVPFYKRAQITAADLALALPGHPWGRFEDLDQLTIFADNLVPHVLRVDGVLEFSPHLLDRIHRHEPIPGGSPEEIEIRASALTAVEMIVEHLRSSGHAVPARQLDYFLWSQGQQPRYKALPRHRTRGVYY